LGAKLSSKLAAIRLQTIRIDVFHFKEAQISSTHPNITKVLQQQY
jgi:hypothetical protein